MTQRAHDSDSPEDAIAHSAPLRVQLLGGFGVTVGDRVVPDSAWRTQKARNLFKILCLSPQHQLHREQLVDLLWPELDPGAAASNLRSTLHAARRALEPDRVPGAKSYLELRRDVFVLDPPHGLTVDVETFDTTAAQASAQQSIEALRSAIDLYTGDLLPGDRYEDWTVAPRESLRDTYLGLQMSLAYLHESRGGYTQAISTLERVIATDVTHEDAHTGLMRNYALSGRPGQALRQFERLKDGLMRELDVEPSVTSQRLHSDIAAGRFPAPDTLRQVPSATGFPDLAMDPAPQHNLPAPLTSFIGRRQELDELHRLLPETRLITLTGVGGSGKTRLALELARQLTATSSDGVWLVELASLADPALVPTTVAAIFGISEHADRSPIQALGDALRSRSPLLVLDNCEHLIDSCARLVETLLMVCPELRVLTTSREALRVPGEVVWRVPPMSLPLETASESPSPDPETLASNEAVALFVDRVRWVRPGFALTAANAPAVEQICRRLDGLPLALELAAARASVLAPEQLAERLDDAMRLLSGGSRTASSRQHTLRATLDWSYALLDRPEQVLLRALAVFSGGWTLDAAEDVCSWQPAPTGDGDSVGADVLTLLAQLVDKSLVQVEEVETNAESAPGIRYRLLETVRQYASAKLEESGEVSRAGERHAAYYLALAEQAEPWLTGPEQGTWLVRLEREHDNLRGALHWLAKTGAIELQARLCVALLRFWGSLGYLVEGDQWFTETIQRGVNADLPLLVRGRLRHGAGMLAWNRGDPARSKKFSRQALVLFQEAGDDYWIANALHSLGAVSELHGDYPDAARNYEEALRLREMVGDTIGASSTMNNLGNVAREQGHLDQAAAAYARNLALQKEIGNKRGIALATSGLGVVALDQKHYAQAATLFQESLDLYAQLGERSLRAMAVQNLGYTAMLQGNVERALELQAQCLRLGLETGDERGMACGLEGLAAAIALAGRGLPGAEQAAHMFGAADGLRERLRVPLPPADLAFIECSMATARNTLGETAYNAAWSAGHALPLEEVITEGLSAASPSPRMAESTTPSVAGILSRREREVTILIAGGHTNTEIATMLGMARPTADKHVSNILRKLGFSSRADIQAWAVENGLIREDETPS